MTTEEMYDFPSVGFQRIAECAVALQNGAAPSRINTDHTE